MRAHIPNFAERIGPLQDLLNEVLDQCKSRTKKSATKISLRQLWSSEHQIAFRDIINQISNQMTMAQVDPRKVICVFTDASDQFFGGIVTQVSPASLHLPVSEQQHEPLGFSSGAFKGSQLRWGTPEKEGFGIVHVVETFDYILLRAPQFRIFTDHLNLKYIYNPHSVDSSLARHVVHKLQRWALKLSVFKYVIEHIKSEENNWADMLTRFGAGVGAVDVPAEKVLGVIFQAPPQVSSSKDNKLPTISDIKKSQKSAIENGDEAPAAKNTQGLFVNETEKVWIPAQDAELQLRMCVAAHCGRGGHRGYETTHSNIAEAVYWETMEADIAAFCQHCLLCKISSSKELSLVPFSPTMQADRPNAAIHFDFLYCGPSKDGSKYVLILKDNFSAYVWLVVCEAATAAVTAQALFDWFSAFGVVPVWISDRGSHFLNEVMKALAKMLRVEHHFTPAYSPHTNGTVETVCKQVLRAIRALLPDFKLQEDEWPLFMPLIQSLLNNSPSRRLANHTPLYAFTKQQSSNPLAVVLAEQVVVPATMDFAQMQRATAITEVTDAVENIHREVRDATTRVRGDRIKLHNKRTGVRETKYVVSDFVLVAVPEKNRRHKLMAKWRGPRRVVRVESDSIYEVENILTFKRAVVHHSRLMHYSDAALEITVELEAAVEHMDHEVFTVKKFTDLRYNPDSAEYEVLTEWKGYAACDTTWEPMSSLKMDCPAFLDKFLKAFRDPAMVSEARECHEFQTVDHGSSA